MLVLFLPMGMGLAKLITSTNIRDHIKQLPLYYEDSLPKIKHVCNVKAQISDL
jgi:hypothetical protein